MREAIYASDRDEDDRRYGVLEIDQPVTFQFNGPQEVRVLRTGMPHLTRGLEIGQLTKAADIDWIRIAVSSAYTARVHNPGKYDHGSGGRTYEIEVLTGQDHDVLVAERKHREWAEFVKLHWWKFGLVLIAIYWWFS